MCVPFITQTLRSAGSYFTYQDWSHHLHSCSASVRGGCSISPQSLQGRGEKEMHVYNPYRGAIKCYSCRCSQCFQSVLQHSASVFGATETDSICHPWQSWYIALIKPLFIWKEKHAIKHLSVINQFISWSYISWQVNCQPLNAWRGAKLLPFWCSRDPIRGEYRANAVKRTPKSIWKSH